MRHWQWLLDTGLPGDFGQIGEWLNQGEVRGRSHGGGAYGDGNDGDGMTMYSGKRPILSL